MKIGIFDAGAGTTDINAAVATATAARDDGFAHYWLPQIFGLESMTVLAVVGREVEGIGLGTAVVPTYPRHPVTMAQEALTVQQASGGRFTLGIGLSHQMVIENMFGLSFARPASHMEEYLSALMPLIRERSVAVQGETISVAAGLTLPVIDPCPVLVAGLGPRMLRLAGSMADGTITWMTGPGTLESHIIPSITAAADGRDVRVVAALPVAVTDDVAASKEEAARIFSIYGVLPSYRAMLDREGAEGPADVAIIGSADEVSERIRHLSAIGCTDFVAVEFSQDAKRQAATRDCLKGLR